MGTCPHCDEAVTAQYEFLGTAGDDGGMSGQHAKFQAVCPACDAILGAAIMSAMEDDSGIL